jgi:hypothetical protein
MPNARGGKGGNGGSGGYYRATINVTPGQTYSITIGIGGNGGVGGNPTTINGSAGNDGTSTIFNGTLTAPAGKGGAGGLSWWAKNGPNCSAGTAGTNGTVTNYSSSNQVPYAINTSARYYLPVGYVTEIIVPTCCSTSGDGGNGGLGSGGGIITSGYNGTKGEDGYCVIMY